MISLFAVASLLSPFFVEVTPEIRTTYQSLGKLVEDRPMQIVNAWAGWDTGRFGRLGVRNWDVSSLTDRRSDVHRHLLYHTEYGLSWQYDWSLADEWTLKNDIARFWTLYRGFDDEASNKTYHWWQVDQSLENPYLVPYYRIRRIFRGSDYLYFKVGVRKRLPLMDSLYVTPGVFFEGGNGRNLKRVFGENVNGGGWGAGGVGSVTFRLEVGWIFNENWTVFAFVEQYEVVGGDARDSTAASSHNCAHNDWTYGGVGLRMKF